MTLEVRVESATSGGLKLIEHIPPIRPCRLEGKNGIGKSALVRLLVLISGTQPYDGEPGSWKSLRNLVGPTTITITGLAGQYSAARVQLTPELWPEDLPAEIGDWLGTLELDNLAKPIGQLFALLDVVHLTGTERLLETLNHQYSRFAVILGDVVQRLAALNPERAEVGERAHELESASPRVAAEETAERDRLVLERKAIDDNLEALKSRAEDLQKATGLRALLDTGDAAEQEQQLVELRGQLATAKSRVALATSERDAAVNALAKGTAAEREDAKLERALSLVTRKQDGLLSRQNELRARMALIGMAPQSNLLDDAEQLKLREAIEQAEAHQREMHLKAAQTRRTRAENELLDDLRVVLQDAVERGLGATVLAKLNGEDLSVADFLGALGYVGPIDDVAIEELTAANAAVSELGELDRIFVQRSQLAAEGELIRTKLGLTKSARAGQDDLRSRASIAREALDAASAEVRALLVQIGATSRSGLGGLDVADAEAHFDELLARHGVAAADLLRATAGAQESLLGLRATHRSLTLRLDELGASAARRRVLRETLRHRSETDESYGWLRELAASETGSVGSPPPEWSDDTWQRLSDHVAASRTALSDLVRDIEGLASVARDRAPFGRLGAALRAVIEEDALSQLSAPPIADSLFDGGKVLRVNLEEQSVTWSTPTGETRTRPLAAFSSGQQAFGFVRARLQQVADTPTENRLVFLDEFGAFIAADRRRPLAELLTSNELLELAQQVVVVLPLQADYKAELRQTTGKLHEEYERRAEEVSDRGYFTEMFDR